MKDFVTVLRVVLTLVLIALPGVISGDWQLSGLILGSVLGFWLFPKK